MNSFIRFTWAEIKFAAKVQAFSIIVVFALFAIYALVRSYVVKEPDHIIGTGEHVYKFGEVVHWLASPCTDAE